MRQYVIYRECDRKYVTGTLMKSRDNWTWGEKQNAVIFDCTTLPPMRNGEQVEELPQASGIFIGKSWTLEYENGYTYITDVVSASTVSLDDPDFPRPNEPGWVRVPQYVLKRARGFKRRCKRR